MKRLIFVLLLTLSLIIAVSCTSPQDKENMEKKSSSINSLNLSEIV